MGTFKGKGKTTDTKTTTTTKKKSGTRAPAGMVKYKGRFVGVNTAQGRVAMNRLKAKKRAQEAAKKRLGK